MLHEDTVFTDIGRDTNIVQFRAIEDIELFEDIKGRDTNIVQFREYYSWRCRPLRGRDTNIVQFRVRLPRLSLTY